MFCALSVTAQSEYQALFAPLVPGVKIGKLNDVDALEDLVTEDTCGVIVEPIQGEGGVFEASEGFLMALRKRCDAVGSVLNYVEIQVHISLLICSILIFSAGYLGRASYGLTTIARLRCRRIF
jgi:acetylornithine/succinyldiaminopimelate/putrescine aminotransferase